MHMHFIVVQQCQRRWRTLRTAFGKKHKKRSLMSGRTGAVPEETWQYYDQLAFLSNYVVHRK